MKPEAEQDKIFYILGWVSIALAVIGVTIIKVFNIDVFNIFPPCTVHVVLGLYCPGCGGTRAAVALLQGKVLTSLYYHPFVGYVAAVGGWFMISQTIERVSKGKIKIAMHFRTIYLWLALIIIVLHFIIKNGLLLFGIVPMA